jgi:AcrR family transcriptional regulator
MTSGVKRGYRSELRAAQASRTRRAIVTAAADLFTARGYGMTTVDAVAEAAGVSRKTVFTTVGGKLDLLKTALDWAVAGDDQPLPLADRDEVRLLLEQTDPAALIAGWVRLLVDVDSRVGPLVRALDVAAGSDPEAQELAERLQRQRLYGARSIVARLAALESLTPGLTVEEATDIAWLASDPLLHDRMVRLRGWSESRFAEWLSQGLCRQLRVG